MDLSKSTTLSTLNFKMDKVARYGRNQKGNKTLIDTNNFEYNLNKSVNGTQYWRCRSFKQGCKARALTRQTTDILLNEPLHDHSNNLLTKKARLIEEAEIKKASENPTVAPRRVLGDVTNTVLSSNSPVAIYGMRSRDAFAKAVWRERVRASPRPSVPNFGCASQYAL